MKVKKPAEAEKYRLEKIAEAQAKKVKQPQNQVFNNGSKNFAHRFSSEAKKVKQLQNQKSSIMDQFFAPR